MNEKLDDILRLALEIEGLAMLASSNRHELTPELLSLLSEKATMLQATVMQLPAETTEAAETPAKDAAVCCPQSDTNAGVAEAAAFEQQEDAATVEDDADVDMAIVEDDDDEPIMAIVEDDEEEEQSEPAPEKPDEKLEEKLARNRAADIFKAFTINDKFRYVRALFRGSEQEFDDTLATIASMSSFAEAEEYFFEDLCWNPDDPDVEAFMETVKTHFGE